MHTSDDWETRYFEGTRSSCYSCTRTCVPPARNTWAASEPLSDPIAGKPKRGKRALGLAVDMSSLTPRQRVNHSSSPGRHPSPMQCGLHSSSPRQRVLWQLPPQYLHTPDTNSSSQTGEPTGVPTRMPMGELTGEQIRDVAKELMESQA